MYERVLIVDDNWDVIMKDGNYDYKTEMMKNAVKAELLLMEVPVMSAEVFKKSSWDKELLKRSKKRWASEMRASIPNWTRKCDYYEEKIILS